jgi:phage terminase Nu1 subunit (DNA packaging protein)
MEKGSASPRILQALPESLKRLSPAVERFMMDLLGEHTVSAATATTTVDDAGVTHVSMAVRITPALINVHYKTRVKP